MSELTNQVVLEHISKQFGNAISDVHEPYGLLTLTTNRETIVPLIQFLYDNEALQFRFLTTMCGINYPDNPGQELGMIYHVHSLIHNARIRIKIYFPEADPVVPTLTNLYATANWMEREAYDFYGIIFQGHPNLIRILNVEEMDYFPMRKQYPLEDGTREDKIDLYFGR